MPHYPDPVNHPAEQVADLATPSTADLETVGPPQKTHLTPYPRHRDQLRRSVQPEALPPVRMEEFLPSLSRWTTFGSWFIVGLLGLAAMASTVVNYRTTVKTTATIRPAGEARLVQAGAEGSVTNIVVNDYEPVKKGQVIAYLDNSRLRTRSDQLESNVTLAQGQLTQIKAQLRALEQQMNAELLQVQRMVAASEAELARAERTYRDQQIVSTAEVQEAEAQLNLARQELESYRQLVDDGAIAKLQLAEKEAALQTAQARLTKLQAGLNPTSADVVAAQAKIAQEQSRETATLAQFNQSREQLVQQGLEAQNQLNRDRKELAQVKKELEYTAIRASATGILYGLTLRNVGQMLRPGETVAQIIPSNVPLELKAIVPSDQIGKVKVGQPTQMQVSACPLSIFGTLPGKVKSVSPDTTPLNTSAENGAAAPPAQITRSGYTVIVEPEDRILQTGQRTCELLPGAEGRLTIISRQETVLSFLLRKGRLQTNF